MKRRAPATLLLPMLWAWNTAQGVTPRRVGKTPPNVVVADSAGVKRRLPILKSYPESLFNGNPKSYISRLVFVPDSARRLKRMVVRSGYPGPTTDSKTYTERMVGFVLFMLLDAAPHRFPRGSKLDEVEVKGSVLRVSLSKAFAYIDFYRDEARGRAALYAIVNTAIEHDYAGVKRVQVLIEDKPVARLGSIKTDRPLSPDLSLVSGP